VAFAREEGDTVLLTAAPRFVLGALESPQGLVGAYEGTFLELPEEYEGIVFRSVFTGHEFRPERGPGGVVLPLAPLLADFPVVLLERSA
jgi:(1->4)-alpha-D-glucan 1-alpha-D-glucosylmutase